jgi:hypothetical protein
VYFSVTDLEGTLRSARRRSRHFAPYRNSALGRAKLLLHRPVRQQALFRRGRHIVYRRVAELAVQRILIPLGRGIGLGRRAVDGGSD